MRVSGTARASAPVAAVWAALRDPDTLASAIPGCRRLEVAGPGRYQVTVITPIAAVAGTYSGEVHVREAAAAGGEADPGDAAAVPGEGAAARGREAADPGGDAADPGGEAAAAGGEAAFPGHVTARVSVAGDRGSVSAEVMARLSGDGDAATVVSYEIDAQVGGAIAGVGQLVLGGVARRLAAQFVAGLASAPASPAGAVPVPVPVPGPATASASVPPPAAAGWVAPAEAAGNRKPPAVLIAGAAAGLAGFAAGAVLGRLGRVRGRGRE